MHMKTIQLSVPFEVVLSFSAFLSQDGGGMEGKAGVGVRRGTTTGSLAGAQVSGKVQEQVEVWILNNWKKCTTARCLLPW